jgi:hypothetical protein
MKSPTTGLPCSSKKQSPFTNRPHVPSDVDPHRTRQVASQSVAALHGHPLSVNGHAHSNSCPPLILATPFQSPPAPLHETSSAVCLQARKLARAAGGAGQLDPGSSVEPSVGAGSGPQEVTAPKRTTLDAHVRGCVTSHSYE